MQINLTDAQLRELRRALDIHLKRLQVELVDTDDRAYRASLREVIDTLEGTRLELDRQAQPVEAVISG